jgi:hypothetical protein
MDLFLFCFSMIMFYFFLSGAETSEEEEEDDPLAFAEEQNLVGSLVHVMKARNNPAMEFEMLLIVRKYFGTGGKVQLCEKQKRFVLLFYFLFFC